MRSTKWNRRIKPLKGHEIQKKCRKRKKNGVIPTNPKEDEAPQEHMKEKASSSLDCAKKIARISIPMINTSRDMSYYKKTKREINFWIFYNTLIIYFIYGYVYGTYEIFKANVQRTQYSRWREWPTCNKNLSFHETLKMPLTAEKTGRIPWNGSRTNKPLGNYKKNRNLLMQSENEKSKFEKCSPSNAIRSNVEDCLSLTSFVRCYTLS